MYKKLAILLLAFMLAFGTLLAQEETAEEATSDDASLEEVTTDSPTADIGVDAPVDDSVEGVVAPADDATMTDDTAMTDDTTVTSTASTGKTYFDGVNTYANSMVKFKLKTADNFLADKIMYSINDTGDLDYASPFAIDDEGKHNIKYWGIDKIGNIENQKVFSVYIDNTAPEVTVTTDAPVREIDGKYYISEENTVTITAKDTMAGLNNIQYTFDGTEYVNYSTSFRFTVAGDVSFMVKAEDNVGNVAESFRVYLPDVSGTLSSVVKRTLSFYVDKTVPTVAIAADRDFIDRGGKKVAGNDYKYTITAEDTESGIKEILYRADGKGPFRKFDGEFTLPTNGDHFIEAKSIDNVGNISKISILSIYVDVIPPSSTITTITEDGETTAP